MLLGEKMTLDELAHEAATKADASVAETMLLYSLGAISYEKPLTGALVGGLANTFKGNIGGLKWNATIPKDASGSGGEEDQIGADILIHVELNTPLVSYSKGVLVQAKRVEPGYLMNEVAHAELREQCQKMLDVSSHAFVFDYAKRGMRCGPANRVKGTRSRQLYRTCSITPYRFFFELFRCPIGDDRITSASVDELPVPSKIYISARGELDE